MPGFFFLTSRHDELNIVVKRELIRMRPQPHRIRFLVPLVVDVGLSKLFGEHVALQQERVVVFQASSASSSEAGIDGTFFSSSGERS